VGFPQLYAESNDGEGDHVLTCCAIPRKCAVYGPAGRLKSSVRKIDNKRKIVIVIVIIQAITAFFLPPPSNEDRSQRRDEEGKGARYCCV
jgi:hypothetical protein